MSRTARLQSSYSCPGNNKQNIDQKKTGNTVREVQSYKQVNEGEKVFYPRKYITTYSMMVQSMKQLVVGHHIKGFLKLDVYNGHIWHLSWAGASNDIGGCRVSTTAIFGYVFENFRGTASNIIWRYAIMLPLVDRQMIAKWMTLNDLERLFHDKMPFRIALLESERLNVRNSTSAAILRCSVHCTISYPAKVDMHSWHAVSLR